MVYFYLCQKKLRALEAGSSNARAACVRAVGLPGRFFIFKGGANMPGNAATDEQVEIISLIEAELKLVEDHFKKIQMLYDSINRKVSLLKHGADQPEEKPIKDWSFVKSW